MLGHGGFYLPGRRSAFGSLKGSCVPRAAVKLCEDGREVALVLVPYRVRGSDWVRCGSSNPHTSRHTATTRVAPAPDAVRMMVGDPEPIKSQLLCQLS